MIRFYPLILILQVYCLYHAYKNKSEYIWFWVIIILPFIGSLIYLYIHVYSRKNVTKLAEGVKHTFVSNYAIDKLEKEIQYADTVTNRLQLADVHSASENYLRAIELYESCLSGMYEDDPTILLKLIKNHYLMEHYDQVIEIGEKLEGRTEFKNADARIAYAWALFRNNQMGKAKEQFEGMNVRFSNYKHRIDYADFLKRTGQVDQSKQLLQHLLLEIDSMDQDEKRAKRSIHKQIKGALQN